MKGLILSMATLLLTMALTLTNNISFANDHIRVYEVTVTNLTNGQLITPPIVISHKGSFKLFTPGQPSTPELAALAEDGDPAPLQAHLDMLPDVFAHTAGAEPIAPGGSVRVQITSRDNFRKFTVAGMLATSNDAFFSVRSAMLPQKRNRGKGMIALAYDAGSEENTESCFHIPGPPCGSPGVRATDGAEGFVHVHRGIHGTGDLDEALLDWRNPVAKVSIRRVAGYGY